MAYYLFNDAFFIAEEQKESFFRTKSLKSVLFTLIYQVDILGEKAIPEEQTSFVEFYFLQDAKNFYAKFENQGEFVVKFANEKKHALEQKKILDKKLKEEEKKKGKAKDKLLMVFLKSFQEIFSLEISMNYYNYFV